MATYTISGVVTDVGNGSGIDNVTVLLSGTKYATAVTNFSSGYSFSGLPADGDYTVTAYSSGANELFTNVLMLAPASRTFTGLSGNVTANFSARRLNFESGDLNPLGIAQGDLNGDGKLDLAVATTTGTNIHVLIGNGDGTFQTQVPYVADANPLRLVIADFNADGKLDVASANAGSTVSVFIGNGDGTLRPRVNYPVGTQATCLTSSDLNGDGKIDLAVLASDNRLNILLGNGDGTFNAAISKHVPTAVGSVSVGDFNADSKQDLALMGFPNSALILLGNGDGTFADAVTYAAGTAVRKGVVADVNADGKLDLTVADDRAFTILLGNGDGTFQGGIIHNLLTNTSDIISGDFDGDGKLDLAIANYFGGISFSSGNGDGTFKPAVGYPAGLYTSDLVGGDFNNDGQRDLAATNSSNISVLLNTTLSRAPALQFSSASYDVDESAGSAVVTVTRTSPTSGAARVTYSTVDNSSVVNCNVLSSQASSRCDYESKVGTLLFGAGETSKTISIPIINDSYAESAERFLIILSNESGANLGPRSIATINITDNDSVNGPNPIDQADFFVRQHYIEFLNREPDASGLAFWSNQITECQQPGATCDAAVRRVNVSAAFFLSIEFQETGYLVYRMYKASYGDIAGAPVPVMLNDFLPDTQQIGQGVIVGALNWQTQLEDNKAAFALDFVSRPRFAAKYGATLTPTQFVDALYALAGVVSPPASERAAAINEFGGAGNTADTAARGRALRWVAENQSFAQQELNKAFVLMQYFGYLRRNPDDAPEPGLNFDGYNFWLGKLNQFNGNFVNAEMVKAFILSVEYRQRFGP